MHYHQHCTRLQIQEMSTVKLSSIRIVTYLRYFIIAKGSILSCSDKVANTKQEMVDHKRGDELHRPISKHKVALRMKCLTDHRHWREYLPARMRGPRHQVRL